LEHAQKRLSLSNDIFLCETAIELIRIGDEDGITILEGMKIDTQSFESILAGINRKKTSIQLLDSKQQKESKKERVSFEKMLASVEIQIGYQIKPEEISLARWVGILDTLKTKNEASKEAAKNSRR
jgi:hypothetical protein